jgi:hypothetical protein
MAITPLADGGYVETTSESLPFPFLYLHVQKYDAAGNPVGERHSFYPAGGGSVYALPNGGYVLAYAIAGGGHGPQSTALYVFDATSTETDNTVFGQSYISDIVISSDAFAVGSVHPAFSSPETDAAFSIHDLSGHLIVGATIDNAPTISLLASGDFSISWSDDGGDAHTLIVDPQNPPLPPETPIVTALDDVGPVQGPIDIITDDMTPTIRVAVDGIGIIETGFGFFGDRIAVTADDAARGYKDIEISLTGAGGFGMQLRFQDPNGLLTGWTFVSFDFDPLTQVLFGNDTPGQVLTGGIGNDAFYAGRNSVVMTSGGGADVFVFEHLPWNGGRITDFALGFDRLDFTDLFSAIGYGGFDPVADGYMRLESDGHGGTRVYFDPDGLGSGNPWPFLMITLEGVSPVGLFAPTLFHPFLFPPGPLTLTADDTRNQVLNGGNASDIFFTGHNSVVMTGGSSDDTFVFEHVPWNNTGHITDFQVALDRLDLSAVFTAVGYTGSDPVADGYIRLESDGAGGTRIQFDADGFGSATRWPSVITTLDHLAPEIVTWQVLSTGYAPEPPGLVLIADDTRGQVLNGGAGLDVFYAGHNSVVMTGGANVDLFVFDYLPWNGGHITDFVSGSDVLDLRPVFSASGYAGPDPITDGYLRFESDGAGGTNVKFDPDGPATGNRWPFLIVTLDHVQPSGVHTGDWLFA